MRPIRPITTLCLPTLAAASSVVEQTSSISESNGFFLIAKITDPSRDLNPSVDGLALGTVHTGAGQDAAVFYAEGPGRIFYQNGTAGQAQLRQTTILTDGGRPVFPSGICIQVPDEPRGIISIKAGKGTYSTTVGSDAPALANGLGAGTFLACNATVPYYRRKFITLQYAYGAGDEVPAACAPIALVPQCTALDDVPEGSYSSHEFAQQVPCYEEVVVL